VLGNGAHPSTLMNAGAEDCRHADCSHRQ
jgi:Trk K+ transport system NAD-binding subunit